MARYIAVVSVLQFLITCIRVASMTRCESVSVCRIGVQLDPSGEIR